MTLLDDVIEAHGGRAAWERARAVRARVRCGGLLLRTRLPGNRFREGLVEGRIGEPVSSAGPFPRAGVHGVFDHGAVRLETDDGELLESREHPRELFFGPSGLRRNLRWDALDATYFAGYAWWNYLNAPYLLAREDVRVAEIEPWDQRRRDLAAARGSLPRGSRHALAGADVLLRLVADAAPPRLRRRGRRPVGARRPHVRRPRRGRRFDLPDPALGAPDRPG